MFRSKSYSSFKDCKIMQCKLIDAAINMSTDLTGRAECILIIYKKQCQIVVPQISRKSIGTCDLRSDR